MERLDCGAHEGKILHVVPMRQTGRVSKLMGPYYGEKTRKPQGINSNNHRFAAALGPPCASEKRWLPNAEVDPLDNLDVGGHAMHRFQSGCVRYASGPRCEGVDRTFELEFHVAVVVVVVSQYIRSLLQYLFDVFRGQRTGHPRVNTDCQRVYFLCACWLGLCACWLGLCACWLYPHQQAKQ